MLFYYIISFVLVILLIILIISRNEYIYFAEMYINKSYRDFIQYYFIQKIIDVYLFEIYVNKVHKKFSRVVLLVGTSIGILMQGFSNFLVCGALSTKRFFDRAPNVELFKKISKKQMFLLVYAL